MTPNTLTRTGIAALLALSCACGVDGLGAEDTLGGKADVFGSSSDENVVYAATARPGLTITDPACENCDAIGGAHYQMPLPAGLQGSVRFYATIHHPVAEDLRMSLGLNQRLRADAEDPWDFEDDGSWSTLEGSLELVDEGPISDESCNPDGTLPCHAMTVMGFLGQMEVPAYPTSDAALAGVGVLRLVVDDLGLKDPVTELNGYYLELVSSDPTTGRLVEVTIIIDSAPEGGSQD